MTTSNDTPSFVGRAIQINVAREAISESACISFVGIPKAGLTSLLNRLMAQDFRDQCAKRGASLRFVQIDCSLYPDPLALMRYIMSHITPDRPVPNLPNWRLLCGRFIAAVRELVPTRLVLLFDDFELMGSNEIFVDFFETLRALTIGANMSLITTTHTELHRCCHKRISSSPFPNIFKVQYLGPWNRDEACDFIRAASASMSAAIEPYADQILNVGGRFPYYVGLTCAHYHQALAHSSQMDAQSMTALLLESSRPEFDRIWQGLEEAEKRVLAKMAHGERAPDVDLPLLQKGYVSEGGVFSLAFGAYVAQMIS